MCVQFWILLPNIQRAGMHSDQSVCDQQWRLWLELRLYIHWPGCEFLHMQLGIFFANVEWALLFSDQQLSDKQRWLWYQLSLHLHWACHKHVCMQLWLLIPLR
jgi:hypothetical protein